MDKAYEITLYAFNNYIIMILLPQLTKVFMISLNLHILINSESKTMIFQKLLSLITDIWNIFSIVLETCTSYYGLFYSVLQFIICSINIELQCQVSI